jgi:hypothetical protein
MLNVRLGKGIDATILYMSEYRQCVRYADIQQHGLDVQHVHVQH